MISILLTVLKIIGIILLVLLGVLLMAVLLVLFVPVRYNLHAHRDLQEEAALVAKVKVTWLLHLISVCFFYPDAAYVRAKILGITIYRSDQEKKNRKKEKSGKEKDAQKKESAKSQEALKKEENSVQKESCGKEENRRQKEDSGKEENRGKKEDFGQKENSGQEKVIGQQEEKERPSIKQFFMKLIQGLKNIKYTIRQICDKIKHIVRNIRYYLDVIQSETFQRAFLLCRKQVLSLLKSVLPKKITGKLLIGTGDPASTGQVLAIYGMLYPLIGDNIVITPDFEQQIIEGELLIKGRITAGKLLKVAFVVFFNKDIRRVIKLLKREVK